MSSSLLFVAALLGASARGEPPTAVETVPSTASAVPTPTTTNSPPDVYRKLGVRPPSWAPFGLNRWSWRVHGRILPLLHWGDNVSVPDVHVNLRVLWCKALSAVDPSSAVYEGPSSSNSSSSNSHNGATTMALPYSTYRMLPPASRWIVWHFWRLFPRWMHANIELRTAYLRTAIVRSMTGAGGAVDGEHEDEEESTDDHESGKAAAGQRRRNKTCLVVLGGGYDPRGAALLANGEVDLVYELDLPQVVSAKGALLRARFPSEVGPFLGDADGGDSSLRLRAVDLNDAAAFEGVLDGIQSDLASRAGTWDVIVLSEALFLYLDPGVPGRIVERLGARRFGGPNNGSLSLVFADRIVDVDGDETAGGDDDDGSGGPHGKVRAWLDDRGWTLRDFMSKPGATRHLGIATAKGVPVR